jgi:hypothetical protein
LKTTPFVQDNKNSGTNKLKISQRRCKGLKTRAKSRRMYHVFQADGIFPLSWRGVRRFHQKGKQQTYQNKGPIDSY